MRAQQVTDLNAARKGVADLQKQLATLETVLAEMQKALGLGDGSTVTNVINTAQISCQVISGQLHILGATKLIAAGYVPYLFRLTRKRNQYHHKLQYRTMADADKRYCSPTKGWHLYGSCRNGAGNGECPQVYGYDSRGGRSTQRGVQEDRHPYFEGGAK